MNGRMRLGKKAQRIAYGMLLSAIMIGCETASNITLPPMPQRQEINEPQEEADYAGVIVYYEALVEKWEAWGQAVTALVENKQGGFFSNRGNGLH